MSPLLVDLLARIRTHEGLPELLKLVQRPRLQLAKLSEAEKPDVAHFRFVYQSGQVAQHEAWLVALTGKPTSQQEIE